MSTSSGLTSIAASSGTLAGAIVTDDSKTLSRNALYTPLRAYEQDQIDPNTYMGTLKSIPISLKESSLSSFMHRVSEDYHRNRAKGPDPKNNGSRPISVSDMEDRLRQRAVTLVGGGINSSMITSKKGQSRQTKDRKRPRREWKEVEAKLKRNNPTSMDVITFLRSTNDRWNNYIHQVLQIGSNKVQNPKLPDEMDLRVIKAKLIAVRDDIELSGARVRIDSCRSKRHLVNVHGLLVSETKNTWSIAIPKRPQGKKRKRSEAHDDDGTGTVKDSSGTTDSVDIVLVPKDGSSLDIIIPLSLGTGTPDLEPTRSSTCSQDAVDSMFPISTRSIFVKLSTG